MDNNNNNNNNIIVINNNNNKDITMLKTMRNSIYFLSLFFLFLSFFFFFLFCFFPYFPIVGSMVLGPLLSLFSCFFHCLAGNSPAGPPNILSFFSSLGRNSPAGPLFYFFLLALVGPIVLVGCCFWRERLVEREPREMRERERGVFRERCWSGWCVPPTRECERENIELVEIS